MEIVKYYKSAPLPSKLAVEHLPAHHHLRQLPISLRIKAKVLTVTRKALHHLAAVTTHSSVLILTFLLFLEHSRCAPTSDKAFAPALCTPLPPALQPQVWNIPLNILKACSLPCFLLCSNLRVIVSAFLILFLKYKLSPPPCPDPLILFTFLPVKYHDLMFLNGHVCLLSAFPLP